MTVPKPHTMKISSKLWRFLNTRKNPGDNFEEVIWRIMGDENKHE